MAVEIAARDKNNVPVMLARSSSTSQIRMLQVDESTGRLLVDVGTISVSASSASDGSTGAAVPTSASYIGGSKAGNLTGLLIGSQTSANSLAVVIASDQGAIGVTGTFWQATQPVSLVSVPSHAVTNAGTFAVQATEADGANVTLGAKADAKSTATDTTAVSIMSVLKQISASVQAPPSQAVTNAGTFAVQAAGDTANAASDAGNPVKIGGVGKTANPTAVTDGQRVNGLFDKLGKQIVVGAIRDLKGVQQTQISSSTAETTIVTQVASTFLDLYGLSIANTSATATKVTIKDSTSGTTRAVVQVPAGETRGFMLPVDSAIPQATVNTNWTATCGTSVAAIEITALYVKNI
jgi:hypothetical protein